MSFNELNSVEHYIVSQLSGVNLNATASTPPSDVSIVEEDGATHGTFPWQCRSAADLNRSTEQVLLEGELREALIRINPEIHANPAFAGEVIYKLRAIFVTAHQTGLVRANEEFHAWLTGEKSMRGAALGRLSCAPLRLTNPGRGLPPIGRPMRFICGMASARCRSLPRPAKGPQRFASRNAHWSATRAMTLSSAVPAP